MTLYRLIKGSDTNIEEFESKVSEALENGYEIESELITKVIPLANGNSEVMLLQPLVLQEVFERAFHEEFSDEYALEPDEDEEDEMVAHR